MSLFKSSKIFVIGDLMVDHYVYGTVDRLSPEAPVPVLDEVEEKFFLGGAALVASNLSSLGAKVDLLCVCSNDSHFEIAKNLLRDASLNSDSILLDNSRKTTCKKRFVATSPYFQQLLRVDHETKDPISSKTLSAAKEKIDQILPKVDLVVVSDYNKGFLTSALISYLMKKSKELKKIVIVDGKKNLNEYSGATILVPNAKELCLSMGIKSSNEDSVLENLSKTLSKSLNCTIVIKRSAKGASIWDSTSFRTYPTSAKEVVNVSGAGDVFVAIMSLSIANGKSLDESVKIANYGCSKAIAKRHPSVSLGDFESFESSKK